MLTLIGAGAVGTTLASYLAMAGQPIRLYTRPKDAATFAAATQLRLERPHRPALIAGVPEQTSQLFDEKTRYLVIATKFSALEPLLAQLRDAPATLTVVSTLNGVRALPLIRERVPQCPAAALTIMFNAQHSGVLQARLTTKPAVILASPDQTLRQLLGRSGLAVGTAVGEQACWGKLMINLANAIGALCHSTFRDLLSQPDLRALFVATLDEAVRCIEAANIAYKLPMPLPYRGYRALLKHGGPLAWWLAQLRNGLDDGAYPSMVSDVMAGRATEVQQLNGEIVTLGQQLGIATPVNAGLVRLVEALDRQQPGYCTPAELRWQLQV